MSTNLTIEVRFRVRRQKPQSGTEVKIFGSDKREIFSISSAFQFRLKSLELLFLWTLFIRNDLTSIFIVVVGVRLAVLSNFESLKLVKTRLLGNYVTR